MTFLEVEFDSREATNDPILSLDVTGSCSAAAEQLQLYQVPDKSLFEASKSVEVAQQLDKQPLARVAPRITLSVSNTIQSSTTTIRRTYTLAGQPVAMRVSGDPETNNNGLFFIYTDHLGSGNIITDANGTAVSQLRFLPFGEYH